MICQSLVCPCHCHEGCRASWQQPSVLLAAGLCHPQTHLHQGMHLTHCTHRQAMHSSETLGWGAGLGAAWEWQTVTWG